MSVINVESFSSIQFRVDTTKENSSTWLMLEEYSDERAVKEPNPLTPRVWFGTTTSFFFGLAYDLETPREGVYRFRLVRQPVTQDILSYAGKETRLKLGEYAIGECPKHTLSDMMGNDLNCGIQLTRWSGERFVESRPEPSGDWKELDEYSRLMVAYSPEEPYDGFGRIYGMSEPYQVEYLRNNPIVNQRRGDKIKEYYNEADKPRYEQSINLTRFALFWGIQEVMYCYNNGLDLIDVFPKRINFQMAREKVDFNFPSYGGKVKLISVK